MRTIPRLVISVMAAVLFIGCGFEDVFAGSARFNEDFHYTKALAPGGRLSVESFNGSIEVIGWDKEEVEITGTKYASSEGLLQAIDVDVVATGDFVQVRTVRPSGRRGNMGARYVIRAPRDVNLDRLLSSNGSVTVSEIAGDARIKTSNGKIRVTGVTGDIDVVTSNGSVKLEDTSGSAVIRTSNGSITAESVSGHLEAETSNGSITARVFGDGGERPIMVSSSNGSINLRLDGPLSSDIIAVTSNASITLRAPESLAADLKARTSNSSIKTDFDVQVTEKYKKTRLEGTINGGGPLIDLKSSNGGIKLLVSNEPEV